ncbi:MAG: hypothetical protein RMJ56_04125 [Gemmataceae bacterium]|nr:hypothetical protein [Gemmata sp.]MDW8196776.1 hypothetical protein [Gemmataceae bacterium]
MKLHSLDPLEPPFRDPFAAYIHGDPQAVAAAAPPEPSASAWETTRQAIHAKLFPRSQTLPQPANSPRRRPWVVGSFTALTAVAATVVGLLLANDFSVPALSQFSLVHNTPAGTPATPSLPNPTTTDELGEMAILPIATEDEVVLHRVPGDGWLPIGRDLLPALIVLAGPDEVEMNDTPTAWPPVVTAPDAAPMIFAAKPR